MITKNDINEMLQSNKLEVQADFMSMRDNTENNSKHYNNTLDLIHERNSLKYLLDIDVLTDLERTHINSLLIEDLSKNCFRIKIEQRSFDGNDCTGLMFTEFLDNQIIDIEDNETALLKYKELLFNFASNAFDKTPTNYGYIEIAHYVNEKPILTKLSISHMGNQVFIDLFLENMYILDNAS